MSGIYAGVEAGGTTFVVGVADPSDAAGPRLIEPEVEVSTADPETTIGRVAEILREQGERHGELSGLGIAGFGPLDLDPGSATYGRLLETPKAGWRGVDLVGMMRAGIALAEDTPIGLDTDVNAAALAEWAWGAGRGRSSVAYVTVGTGIGGGAVVHDRPLHGRSHPEMGHVTVPRHPGDAFPGACPRHPSCLEGMAAGPALAARAGEPAHEIPGDDPIWDLEAWYLGRGLATVVLVLAPEVITLGGGVMQREGLHELVAGHLDDALAGYVPVPRLVRPRFGNRNGLMGAFRLARASAPS
jgi:fructokinase